MLVKVIVRVPGTNDQGNPKEVPIWINSDQIVQLSDSEYPGFTDIQFLSGEVLAKGGADDTAKLINYQASSRSLI